MKLYRKITIEIDEGNHIKHIEISNEELMKQIKLNKKLKQENKELKDNLEVIDKSACFWEDTSDNYKTRMNNYLSRIDKAIEYIKNDWYKLNTRDIEHCINLNKDIRIDLLNILQGSDDNGKEN